MVHIDKILQNVWKRFREKRKEKRDNKIIARNKEVYCIIKRRKNHYKEGLFASYLAVIKMIYEAKLKGLIPVIDMQTEKNPYLTESEVGKINAWELFFQQPAGITLNQVKYKKNLIYLYEPPYDAFPSDSMDFLTNPEDVQFWREFIKTNIIYTEAVKKYIHKYDDIYMKIREHRTLGVYLRGTDYANIQPINHAVVPEVVEGLDKVKQIMQEQKCSHIFLSVEDEIIQKAYEKEFGENLLYIKQLRYTDTGKNAVMLTEEFQKSNIRETGLQYLTAVHLISKCNCLFAARCCGSVSALLISEGYDYAFFWNRGRYKKNHMNQ